MKKGHAAEGALAHAREQLLRGDTASVAVAATCIAKAVELLQHNPGPDPPQLCRIRQQVGRLHALLEGTRVFHEGLARLYSPADHGVANYTRSGQTCASWQAQSGVAADD